MVVGAVWRREWIAMPRCLTWAPGGFFARYAKPLASFPKVFTANAQFLCQFGFTHLVLVFEDKVLKIIF